MKCADCNIALSKDTDYGYNDNEALCQSCYARRVDMEAAKDAIRSAVRLYLPDAFDIKEHFAVDKNGNIHALLDGSAWEFIEHVNGFRVYRPSDDIPDNFDA